jgi:AcrR family transcriptional regulator
MYVHIVMSVHIQAEDVNRVNMETMSVSENRPYHHGNLKAALVEAAVARARLDGPDGLGLRDIAADVGVAPSAAYRHVRDRDHLVTLVAQAAREELARNMRAAIDRVIATGDEEFDAVARLMACGRGYVSFATESPLLFRTAFLHSGCLPDRADDPNGEAELGTCLDDLVTVGLLEPENRRDAATLAWSAVHGLGALLADQAMAVSFALSATDAIEAVLTGVVRAIVTIDSHWPTVETLGRRAAARPALSSDYS